MFSHCTWPPVDYPRPFSTQGSLVFSKKEQGESVFLLIDEALETVNNQQQSRPDGEENACSGVPLICLNLRKPALTKILRPRELIKPVSKVRRPMAGYVVRPDHTLSLEEGRRTEKRERKKKRGKTEEKNRKKRETPGADLPLNIHIL